MEGKYYCIRNDCTLKKKKNILQILHIENETNEFVYYHTLDYMESPAYKRGSELVLLLTTDRHPHYLMKTQSEVLDNLTKFQQVT